jgi:hypothetical protein
LGEELPITSAKFIENCSLHLSQEDLVKLEAVRPDPEEAIQTPVHRAWVAWETFFRNALVKERAGKHNVRPEESLRPESDVYPGVLKQISDAFAAGNPAAREFALDELRWRRLDELAAAHPFDFEALVVYRLRLHIAERWARKDVGTAWKRLNDLPDAVETAAQDARSYMRT